LYGEILEYIAAQIDTLSLYAESSIGDLPEGNGISVQIGAGSPVELFQDKGNLTDCFVIINAKHIAQGTALSSLSDIHLLLTRLKEYPSTDDYDILNIETSTIPNYIGKADTGEWVYGSIIKIQIYIKGE
jgi:hypothetical protein